MSDHATTQPPTPEDAPRGSLQAVVRRICTTHHHACDCRESALLETLWGICKDLRSEGMKGNEPAFAAFVEINEHWLEWYGCEILDDPRVPPNAPDQRPPELGQTP